MPASTSVAKLPAHRADQNRLFAHCGGRSYTPAVPLHHRRGLFAGEIRMSQLAVAEPIELNIDHLITEDDQPVDNWYSEKQQRLLTEALFTSWHAPLDENGQPRKFVALANVGMFYAINRPPFVPDMFLSLDVEPPPEFSEKRHRSYFHWEFGKMPEVVVEVVSNREGGEDTLKLREYARLGIDYYIIHDPFQMLSQEALRVYEIGFRRYRRRPDFNLPTVGLSLTLWRGVYEGVTETWLRWCDAQGNLILTGAEAKSLEATRADLSEAQTKIAEERASEAEERASEAEERAAKLAAKLRELGIDPSQL
jgi:Uma2 family endonuclease